MKYKYQYLAVGGTFDHLHRGHKKLLDTAFSLAPKVAVALTVKDFSQHKEIAQAILPYHIRYQELLAYLKNKNFIKRASIFPLHDIYGIARDDKTLDSIIVTKKTYNNAVKINKLRLAHALPHLNIIKVSYIKSSDGRIITSTRIRKGEINRDGVMFIKLFKKSILHLPEHLRSTLRKPLGKLIEGEQMSTQILQSIQQQKPVMVITVGDIITQSLDKVCYTPAISIIDYKSRRMSLTAPQNAFRMSTPNEPGTLNYRSVQALKKAIQQFLRNKKTQKLVIRGEEDLLTLAAVLFAPLNSLVLYGQLDQGVVTVRVSEEKKEKVVKILKQFE